jgi:predicted  nucleic acid-binding Zn-ribbon protein
VEELQKANAALQEQHQTLQGSLQEKKDLFKEDMELIERTRQEASSGND